MVKYEIPGHWIKYDPRQIFDELVAAKAAAQALNAIPYQASWAEELQKIQLKREIAGTSKIEGAEFTERELDDALSESPQEMLTRSQRQAQAAKNAYQWISKLGDDRPASKDMILQIHRLIVTGAEDCPPGKLRRRDENVNFGIPPHRGADGGKECERAFEELCLSVGKNYQEHDIFVQALALHYHLAAMHPFLDGNGRTARAMEAFMLRKGGLKDALFIAMSNYYYDEKPIYLKVLGEVRAKDFDLTPFLKFGLKGIERQCTRLLAEIKRNLSKELFRNMMHRLYDRLRGPKRRVMKERHLSILNIMLDREKMGLEELFDSFDPYYQKLKAPRKALDRDINYLLGLGAIKFDSKILKVKINLEWPTEVTETEFFKRVKEMPKAKKHRFPKF